MLSSSHIAAFGITDVGMKRTLNEDAFLIDNSCGCLGVADGVGGAAAGEIASRIFVSAISAVVREEDNQSEQSAVAAIKSVFFKANTDMLDHTEKNPESAGMACTAELLLFFEGGFALGHVGDSRTYRFRKNELTRLTRDHSFVQQQVELGKITEEEARNHRFRNVILRAVGNSETIDVDVIRGKAKPGDLFLLCSDGLTDMIDEREITKFLAGNQSLEAKARALVAQANREGGRDNITVIIASVS